MQVKIRDQMVAEGSEKQARKSRDDEDIYNTYAQSGHWIAWIIFLLPFRKEDFPQKKTFSLEPHSLQDGLICIFLGRSLS